MKKEWRKDEKNLYLPKTFPVVINIPKMNYLVVDGKGDPNTSIEFQEAMNLLYSISYAIKMAPKNGNTPDNYYEYAVYPLEGIWDLDDEGRKLKTLSKDHLVFSMMIRQPSFVTKELVDKIIEKVKKKYPNLNYNKVRFESITEGLCVQMLHLGSYDNEPASFAKMDAFCKENHLTRTSLIHREIYLSDSRKVASDKLKTVLRYKVKSNI